MSLKEQFAEQLKSQADIWQEQVKVYQDQLQQAGAKAQADYKNAVAQMQEKAEEARKLFNDVDPQAWLADVLARIADHKITELAALLPWNWRHAIPIARAA